MELEEYNRIYLIGKMKKKRKNNRKLLIFLRVLCLNFALFAVKYCPDFYQIYLIDKAPPSPQKCE
jgi:hypothetical protein